MSSLKKEAVTKNYSFGSNYLKYYTEYAEYVNGLKMTEQTKDWRLKHIRCFVSYMESHKMNLSKLKEEDLVKCIVESIKDVHGRTVNNRILCFKYFLFFLRENGVVNLSEDEILSAIKTVRHLRKETNHKKISQK